MDQVCSAALQEKENMTLIDYDEITIGPGIDLDAMVAKAMDCKLHSQPGPPRSSVRLFICGCPNLEHASNDDPLSELKSYSTCANDALSIVDHFGSLNISVNGNIIAASFDGLIGSFGESVAHSICLAAVNKYIQREEAAQLG